MCSREATMLHHRWNFSCLLLLLFLSRAVYGQKVKVEYDPKERFAVYKTYCWVTKESYERPLLALGIIGAVDEQLQAKGLTRVEEKSDLIVSGYGAMDGDLSVSWSESMYVMPGLYGPVWWVQGSWVPGNSTAVYIQKGTLVIDIADPHSKQLKWRGIATAKFNDKNKKELLELVNKSIEKMFRAYPAAH